MLDGSGRRALVASFGTTVGVLQRIETIPDPEIATPPSGSWEGRMIAIDNDNVDEANARRSAVTLECTETTCQGTRGNTAFSLTLTEVGGNVWAGSVQGLSPGDDGTQVRVVVGPDGDLLAISLCADDIGAAGFYCAYVALERRSPS